MEIEGGLGNDSDKDHQDQVIKLEIQIIML